MSLSKASSTFSEKEKGIPSTARLETIQESELRENVGLQEYVEAQAAGAEVVSIPPLYF